MNEIVAALEPVVGALEELGVRYRVGGLGGPTLMGVLHATPARGKHVFSFEYTRAWLDSDQSTGSTRRSRCSKGLNIRLPKAPTSAARAPDPIDRATSPGT